jgi:lipoprotein-anchoring transpeptidase ErfK/SrfK
MPTPSGTRYRESKHPKAWSAKYGLYMPWWQSMGGGYGIHELPEWPGGYKEGESHLGTPVSHGCVRLGVGPAETVYNWTEIGTPVYIH